MISSWFFLSSNGMISKINVIIVLVINTIQPMLFCNLTHITNIIKVVIHKINRTNKPIPIPAIVVII